MIPEPGNWEYTAHVAHRNGWMFGIPLQTRQGWGYLYNDNITTKEDAIDDISERFKTKKEDLNLREFSFKNYYANKIIDGRIIKNGNRALFFEPIEALSGLFYDNVMRGFTDVVLFGHNAAEMNSWFVKFAQQIENTISFIYHGGSNYKSNFWEITTKKAKEKVLADNHLKSFLNLLKTSDKTIFTYPGNTSYGGFSPKNWLDFDTNLGYNYLDVNSNFYAERNNNE